MVKWFFGGILATIVAILACGYIVVRERPAAQTSLDATLRNEAPNTPNPVEMRDDNLVAGIDLYAKHCAICHGTVIGEASASPVAKGLYPPPPQLATDGVEDDPEGVSFWKVKHGIRLTGMPSWKSALSDQQIWTSHYF